MTWEPKKDGYASDITRTLVAGGLDKADETFHKDIFRGAPRPRLEASANIKAGMTGQEADDLARRDHRWRPVIGESVFGHSLGHGVGLMTHEAPSVGPRSGDVLEAGHDFHHRTGHISARLGRGAPGAYGPFEPKTAAVFWAARSVYYDL